MPGYHDDQRDNYDAEEWREMCDMFANPGQNSALRKSTFGNPRNLPCPTCKGENLLTPADKALGYQCDGCADRDEMGMG